MISKCSARANLDGKEYEIRKTEYIMRGIKRSILNREKLRRKPSG